MGGWISRHNKQAVSEKNEDTGRVFKGVCIGGIDRQYCGLKWSREQKIGQLGLIMLDNDVLDW